MAVDQIHRGIDATIRPRLDHPQVAEALKHGDIHKILQALPSGVTRADIEDYLKQRCAVFQQGLVQNVQIKADESSMPPPNPAKHILPMDEANTLTEHDRELMADFFAVGKAAISARAADDIAPGADAEHAQQQTQAFGQNLVETIDERVKAREEFLFKLEQAAFNVHLTQELQSRQHEIREELRRIFTLVKQRKIKPEFAVVALTKAHVMESGLIGTICGMQLKNVSEQQSRVAQSIQGVDATQIKDYEMKKVEMQNLGLEMGSIQQNITMAYQRVQTLEGQGKSMLDEYARTRADLTRNVVPKG